MDHAAWRPPVADGNEKGRGRGDQCERPEQNRQQRQRQRQAVVEHAAIVEVEQLSLLLPGRQASRAKVLAIQLDVAQGAQEPSAGFAWQHGLLVGMIKAACFAFGND